MSYLDINLGDHILSEGILWTVIKKSKLVAGDKLTLLRSNSVGSEEAVIKPLKDPIDSWEIFDGDRAAQLVEWGLRYEDMANS